MADKKKKTVFTPTKETPPVPFGAKKPIILLSDRETIKDENKEKMEKEKPPTIILKTREQSAAKEDWPSIGKGQELDFGQPSKIAYNESKEKKIDQRQTPTHKTMTEPIKLMDESLDVYSPALEYLSDSNTHFVVIGIIGTQGVGKSMVLNILSQEKNVNLCQTILEYNDNDQDEVSDLEKTVDELSLANGIDKPVKDSWFKFKMQSIEHIERNTHCTKGIDMYVTKDRIIYLDCQALWSPSLVEEAPGSSLGNRNGNVVMAGLQLASFIMSVCHVVIAVQDWIVDFNFIRYIQTAEMLKPTLSMPPAEDAETTSGGDTNPHLLLLHNRCGFEDYLPNTVKALQDVYRLAFEKSSLQVNSGMYLYSELSAGGLKVDQLCKGYSVETLGAPLNLFLMPEVKDDSDKSIYHGHPPLGQLADRLRRQVLGASRHQLTNVASLTEKAWFHFCNRAWETIRTSSFFIEYERLLP